MSTFQSTPAELAALAALKAALPPYSGPAVDCPKCGHGFADTQWHPGTYALSVWGQIAHVQRMTDTGEPGWLLRSCNRCAYRWAEATEDARVQA